eukprot:358951-Chlamydomonas_euryale.AAC.4
MPSVSPASAGTCTPFAVALLGVATPLAACLRLSGPPSPEVGAPGAAPCLAFVSASRTSVAAACTRDTGDRRFRYQTRRGVFSSGGRDWRGGHARGGR